jgi:cytochrome P450
MATLTSPVVTESIPTIPGLPLIGNLLAFRRDRLALHERAAAIGPIVRVQLAHIPVHVVTDADLAHQVLVDQADGFKKSRVLQFLEPVLGAGLLTAEGDVHKRHRKLLAPAFAPKRLNGYAEVMVAETRAQIAKWHGQEVDLAAEMMEMTLAIAGKTLFSADVRGDAKTVAEGLELAMRSTVANIMLPIGYRWPLPRRRDMKRAVRMLDEVVYRLIAAGRAAGTDRGDVLSMLLLAADEAGGLSDKQVRDEVMTLLLAGHETTSNALTWAWYELGRNPAALDRLQRELASLPDRAVTPEDLPNLPWNLAVIEEAMRLHPPAYNTGRQTLREIELAGHKLPKDSLVLVNIRGIHRRADYFADPLAFQPERMLPEVKKTRPRHHYLPFGAGPRVCIGSHFALLEAQLVLATLVREAAIRPLSGEIQPEPLVTLRPRGGLPAIVRARTERAARAPADRKDPPAPTRDSESPR